MSDGLPDEFTVEIVADYPHAQFGTLTARYCYAASTMNTVTGRGEAVFVPCSVVDGDGQSPVGCNACDLGDETLPHRRDCLVSQSLPDVRLVVDIFGVRR